MQNTEHSNSSDFVRKSSEGKYTKNMEDFLMEE